MFQSGLEVNDLYSSPFKSDHGPVMIQPLDLAMAECSVADRGSLPEPAQQLFSSAGLAVFLDTGSNC